MPDFFSRNVPLEKKFKDWFVDYSVAPLLVQVLQKKIIFDHFFHIFKEHYMNGFKGSIDDVERAADSISQGDLFCLFVF